MNTAKRLQNKAQGCRASRLPWGTRSNGCNPIGVVSVFQVQVVIAIQFHVPVCTIV